MAMEVMHSPPIERHASFRGVPRLARAGSVLTTRISSIPTPSEKVACLDPLKFRPIEEEEEGEETHRWWFDLGCYGDAVAVEPEEEKKKQRRRRKRKERRNTLTEWAEARTEPTRSRTPEAEAEAPDAGGILGGGDGGDGIETPSTPRRLVKWRRSLLGTLSSAAVAVGARSRGSAASGPKVYDEITDPELLRGGGAAVDLPPVPPAADPRRLPGHLREAVALLPLNSRGVLDEALEVLFRGYVLRETWDVDAYGMAMLYHCVRARDRDALGVVTRAGARESDEHRARYGYSPTQLAMTLGEVQMVATLAAMASGGRAEWRAEPLGRVRANPTEEFPSYGFILGALAWAVRRCEKWRVKRARRREYERDDARIARLVADEDVDAAIPLARRTFRKKLDRMTSKADLGARLAASNDASTILARFSLAEILVLSKKADEVVEGWYLLNDALDLATRVLGPASVLTSKLKAAAARCPRRVSRGLGEIDRRGSLSLKAGFLLAQDIDFAAAATLDKSPRPFADAPRPSSPRASIADASIPTTKYRPWRPSIK